MQTKLATVAAALSLLSSTAAAADAPHHVVTQFPNETWIENIAVRSNGDLLLTQLAPTAALIRVSSPSSASPVTEILWSPEEDTLSGLLGIAELGGNTKDTSSDVFAFVGLHIAVEGTFAGTDSIWVADFSGGDDEVDVSHVADIEGSGLLNGLVALPCASNLVLVADSWVGAVWRVDVTSGAYEKAIQVPEMAPTNASDPYAIGINGVKIHDGYLYWTNSGSVTIFRLAITSQGSPRAGASVETIATPDAPFMDDFTISPDGTTIFAATYIDNSLLAIDIATGESVTVLGSVASMTLSGDTSAAFGRDGDCEVAYVTTSGRLTTPINGTLVEGGKVVAVDVRGVSV